MSLRKFGAPKLLSLHGQLCRDAQHRPRVRQSLIQRLHDGPMLRGNSEMQRIAGAKSECVLVDEPRRRPEV